MAGLENVAPIKRADGSDYGSLLMRGEGELMAYVFQKLFNDHLREQFQRALPVLFTGAGFSTGAMSVKGQLIPSVSELKREIWSLCFPQDPYEDNTSLTYLYDHALLRHATKLNDLLRPLLTVSTDSIPDWYSIYFQLPWYREYTLNIDDLPAAANRMFAPERPVVYLSGAPSHSDRMLDDANDLNVICLNGTVEDLPDRVTFSVNQYADRLANRIDPWYLRLTADLLTHSFVFVGTSLDEPPLWQHIAIRRERGRDLRELRPRSYLVTPTLDRARKALLAEYNVEWVPMSAETFANEVLVPLKGVVTEGLALLKSRTRFRDGAAVLPEVADLARNPTQLSEYLLGQEPVWADIQSSRAIERTSDVDIWNDTKPLIGLPGAKDIVLITGTAGSGKSTALMRICLRLVTEGLRVGWVERDTEISPRDIRGVMHGSNPPNVLAIDDADMYGVELSNLLRDLTSRDPSPLILIAMRATRIHRAILPALLGGARIRERAMPPLENKDIESLLDTLDRENRLGYLKGKPRSEQEKLIRVQCGRHLLVAMIQATSNRRFEDKAVSELNELAQEEKLVYSLITITSSFRFSLARDEIVLAAGSDNANAVLNAVDRLAGRHLIIAVYGGFRVRHRVIAEIVLEELRRVGRLRDAIQGLALLAATKVIPGAPRRERAARLLRAVINHDFLSRMIGPEAARNLYGGFLEGLLAWDYHYWLQRGALELEFGDLSLAEHFLDQANGLGGDDPFVKNEYAYMLFRKALEKPTSIDAPALVEQATGMLEELIYTRGVLDSYPYHVIGSQGLSWARHGIVEMRSKEIYLRRIDAILTDGITKHARSPELQTLRNDVKRAILMLAVPGQTS